MLGSIPRALIRLTLVLAAAASLRAQGMPPSPVRYTEAKERAVRRMIQLPGSVESRTVSLVASEVAGLVEKMHARDGDTVRKGQLLAQLETSNLRLRLQAAEAQLREAEARLHLAKLGLDRARDLFASKVVAQADLDNATYEHDAWQGKVEELNAEISRIRRDIEVSSIRAPFGGLVVAKRTEVGQWVVLGGPVVEMLSLAELEVRVDVPEKHFTSLNPGAEAAVTFDSLPGVTVKGRVSAIIPSADPHARAFPLKIRIPNKEGRIGAGMLAQVSFPAGESYRATVVPKDALVAQGSEQVVYLIKQDNTVTPVAVRPGQGVGAWVVVEGDIHPGNKVVTRGNERLQPGQKVRGEPLEYALP